jgi:hypothetical protein
MFPSALPSPSSLHNCRLSTRFTLSPPLPSLNPNPKADNGFSENSVVALLLLISRSKLVPDFAITLHVIHLLVVSLYSHSIPANALWWALQFSSAAFMTGLGVWSCRWRELRPISFGGAAAAAPAAGEGSASTQPAEGAGGGDEEQGFGRGRGRGRGRDGGGEYEMVGLNKEGEAE